MSIKTFLKFPGVLLGCGVVLAFFGFFARVIWAFMEIGWVGGSRLLAPILRLVHG